MTLDLINLEEGNYCISLVLRQSFSFQNNPKTLRSVLQDGTRLLGLFRKGKTCIIALICCCFTSTVNI